MTSVADPQDEENGEPEFLDDVDELDDDAFADVAEGAELGDVPQEDAEARLTALSVAADLGQRDLDEPVTVTDDAERRIPHATTDAEESLGPQIALEADEACFHEDEADSQEVDALDDEVSAVEQFVSADTRVEAETIDEVDSQGPETAVAEIEPTDGDGTLSMPELESAESGEPVEEVEGEESDTVHLLAQLDADNGTLGDCVAATDETAEHELTPPEPMSETPDTTPEQEQLSETPPEPIDTPVVAREAELDMDWMRRTAEETTRELYRPVDADFDADEPEFDLIDTPPAATDRPRQMRVLVAEDNKTNRLVMEKMVKALNIDLVFAENGLEAVDHYQWQRPDIIFTDISMPKLDGKEAARSIRTIEQALGLAACPMVAITAHAMEGDADDILAAGIDYYLTKPINKAELIAHILAAQPDETEPVLPDESAAIPPPAVREA